MRGERAARLAVDGGGPPSLAVGFSVGPEGQRVRGLRRAAAGVCAADTRRVGESDRPLRRGVEPRSTCLQRAPRSGRRRPRPALWAATATATAWAVDEMREELDEFGPPRAPQAIRRGSPRLVSHPARIRLDSGDGDPALLERSGAVRETLPCHVEIPDWVVEDDAGCLVARPDEMVDHRPGRQGSAARGGVGHTPFREDCDSQTGSSSGP